MFEPGPNDALSQNFMKLGLLVAEKNVNRQTDKPTRFMFYKYRFSDSKCRNVYKKAIFMIFLHLTTFTNQGVV